MSYCTPLRFVVFIRDYCNFVIAVYVFYAVHCKCTTISGWTIYITRMCTHARARARTHTHTHTHTHTPVFTKLVTHACIAVHLLTVLNCTVQNQGKWTACEMLRCMNCARCCPPLGDILFSILLHFSRRNLKHVPHKS